MRDGCEGGVDVGGVNVVAAALRQQGRHGRWEAKARGEYGRSGGRGGRLLRQRAGDLLQD